MKQARIRQLLMGGGILMLSFIMGLGLLTTGINLLNFRNAPTAVPYSSQRRPTSRAQDQPAQLTIITLTPQYSNLTQARLHDALSALEGVYGLSVLQLSDLSGTMNIIDHEQSPSATPSPSVTLHVEMMTTPNYNTVQTANTIRQTAAEVVAPYSLSTFDVTLDDGSRQINWTWDAFALTWQRLDLSQNANHTFD